MKKELVTRLAATGILVAASMAFAKFPSFDLGHSSKKSANLEILQEARLPGGPTSKSGEYKVVLTNDSSTPKIVFYQNGKLVAEVPVKLVDEPKKFDGTEVYYDTRRSGTEVITGMDLGGWREKVLFGKAAGVASSTK